jgi:hypothetical protein
MEKMMISKNGTRTPNRSLIWLLVLLFSGGTMLTAQAQPAPPTPVVVAYNVPGVKPATSAPVLTGVTNYFVETWGGGGAGLGIQIHIDRGIGGAAGGGAYAHDTLSFTSGEILDVTVGRGGETYPSNYCSPFSIVDPINCTLYGAWGADPVKGGGTASTVEINSTLKVGAGGGAQGIPKTMDDTLYGGGPSLGGLGGVVLAGTGFPGTQGGLTVGEHYYYYVGAGGDSGGYGITDIGGQGAEGRELEDNGVSQEFVGNPPRPAVGGGTGYGGGASGAIRRWIPLRPIHPVTVGADGAGGYVRFTFNGSAGFTPPKPSVAVTGTTMPFCADGVNKAIITATTGLPADHSSVNVTWKWYKNGVEVPGATANYIELYSVAESGNYVAEAYYDYSPYFPGSSPALSKGSNFSDPSGTITISSCNLGQVVGAALSNTGQGTWTNLSPETGLANYSIQLYKDGAALGTPKTSGAGTGATGVSFLTEMRTAGVGVYHIVVTAIGNGTTYGDGPPSADSNQQSVVKLLAPANPAWSVNNATFNKLADESNVDKYSVTITGSGTIGGSATADVAKTGANLSVAVTGPANGDTFTVKAIALTTGLYLDSDESVVSAGWMARTAVIPVPALTITTGAGGGALIALTMLLAMWGAGTLRRKTTVAGRR